MRCQLLHFRQTDPHPSRGDLPAAKRSGNKRLQARLGVDVEGGAHNRGIIWLRQVCVAAQQVEAGARVVLVICKRAQQLTAL